MFVLVLVDLERSLGLRVKTLSLLTLLLAECLELVRSMKHRTHHDLTSHGEASWVHLSEHDCTFLPWQHLDVVAGALEWLLELQFVELGVVDLLIICIV